MAAEGDGKEDALAALLASDVDSLDLALQIASYESSLAVADPNLRDSHPARRARAAAGLRQTLRDVLGVLKEAAGAHGLESMRSRLASTIDARLEAEAVAGGVPVLPATWASTAVGGGGGGDRLDEGGSERKETTCDRIAERAQDFSRRRFAGEGRLAALLLEAGATCDSCHSVGRNPGVICFCGSASGHRLCYDCDSSRHEVAARCPFRAVVARSSSSGPSVLRQLEPDEYIEPLEERNGPATLDAWITTRGV